MAHAHIHLLLDANKPEAEFMAECPSCGAITIESAIVAWKKRFIVCECGISIEIAAEHLRRLRLMAAEFQFTIDELIGAN
jgi:uncharacterized heparinase superfamily protein